MTDRHHKQQQAGRLEEPVREARALARKLGLSPYRVNYWIVDHDEMNELIAYEGFQTRYPHWRWGMQYEQQRKQRQFLGGKAFEIVNNDNPAHAFLQESNALADQKAVITHVEAHADFFANNEWFGMVTDDPDAAAMLERHARTVDEYMADPEVDRADVERWIDNALTLEDNINQHRPFANRSGEGGLRETGDLGEMLTNLELSDEVRHEVFDDEWLAAQEEEPATATFPAEPEKDILGFLHRYGKQYDDEAGKAVEMEDWQRDVLDIIRRESYYFAPQKMTKVMNEGWAAFWESMMMGEEAFAGDDEFMDYADHQARVLNSPGLNPYKLGKELWEYVENLANRREVVEHLLRVDGVTWRNFHEVVDFRAVQAALEPDPAIDAITAETLDDLDGVDPVFVDEEALERAKDGDVDVDAYPWKVLSYEGLAARHFSLVKPQHRGFLRRIGREELERTSRYLFDSSRYATIDQALADVDRTAGWDKMFEVRESHNDVTFIDEFLTQEFVDVNNYFTYEYSRSTGQYHATSTDYLDVKKKLLLQFTNLGKPTVAVADGNFNNRNELLLAHQYNGVILNMETARQTLERVFELWGRPVHLKTIVKEVSEREADVAKRRGREPEPEEKGVLVSYDGEVFTTEELAWEDVEDIAAGEVDYDTKPEDWLA
ncbi:SpoVR family protein [Halobacteriaceae archaeon GCM10025711]